MSCFLVVLFPRACNTISSSFFSSTEFRARSSTGNTGCCLPDYGPVPSLYPEFPKTRRIAESPGESSLEDVASWSRRHRRRFFGVESLRPRVSMCSLPSPDLLPVLFWHRLAAQRFTVVTVNARVDAYFHSAPTSNGKSRLSSCTRNICQLTHC